MLILLRYQVRDTEEAGGGRGIRIVTGELGVTT